MSESKKRSRVEDVDPIDESTAALEGYGEQQVLIESQLRSRQQAAYAFLKIMEGFAAKISYEDSLASWRREHNDGEFVDDIVCEGIIDAKYKKDDAATALSLLAVCKRFARGDNVLSLRSELLALYRAIPTDSSFGRAAEHYWQKCIEAREAEEERRCQHCEPVDKSWEGPAFNSLELGLVQQPVWAALAAEFKRRECDKVLEIVIDKD